MNLKATRRCRTQFFVTAAPGCAASHERAEKSVSSTIKEENYFG